MSKQREIEVEEGDREAMAQLQPPDGLSEQQLQSVAGGAPSACAHNLKQIGIALHSSSEPAISPLELLHVPAGEPHGRGD